MNGPAKESAPNQIITDARRLPEAEKPSTKQLAQGGSHSLIFTAGVAKLSQDQIQCSDCHLALIVAW